MTPLCFFFLLKLTLIGCFCEHIVGSYGLGMLVLKHCVTTELTEGEDPQHENSKGIALLAWSTLLSERFFLHGHLVSLVF